jgi:hypothetical protein
MLVLVLVDKNATPKQPGCKMPAFYVLFLLESYFLLLTSYFKTKHVERCPKPEAESA